MSLLLHAQLGFAAALLLALLVSSHEWRGRPVPRVVWGCAALGAFVLQPALASLVSGVPGLAAALLSALGGALICGLPPTLLLLLRLANGSDALLLGACGALLGPFVGLQTELDAFALGTLYAVGQLLFQGHFVRDLWLGARGLLAKQVDSSLTRFRFAPSVLVAVLLSAALHWSRS